MVVYDPLPAQAKEKFKRDYWLGADIVSAIELELTKDPAKRAVLWEKPNVYILVYTPEVTPCVEIRIKYLVGVNGVKVKYFKAVYLE